MGKSGKHVAKRTDVPRNEREAFSWKRAAKRAGFENLCSWIRATLNAEAARLGAPVPIGETLDGDREE